MFIVLFEPMYLYQYVKGIMLLSLLIVLKVFFSLKVNIRYMSIKQAFSLFFVCSLSPNGIDVYTSELSTLPSIPSNDHVGGLC